MNAVISQIDAGTGTSTIEIGTTGMASVLAVFDLPSPCGTASGGVLTFDMDPDLSDASANASGTAAEARIKDGDGTVVISGLTVGTSGADPGFSDYAADRDGNLSPQANALLLAILLRVRYDVGATS